MGNLTLQQTSVFERITKSNESVIAMNGSIRNRANLVTIASTSIVGIITAAKFLPSNSDSSGFEFILLSLVCLCSVGIYAIAALIWKSGSISFAGTTEVDTLYSSYISKPIDVAYHNSLIDLCKSFSENLKDNASKAALLDKMVYILISQLVLLSVAIAWTSLAVLLPT